MKQAVLAATLLAALPAHAAEDPEEAGLRLADEAPAATPVPTVPRAWQLSVEPALMQASPREGGHDTTLRLSVDWAWQGDVAPGWRLHLADRLDLQGPEQLQGEREAVNTWKEGYLSHAFDAQTSLDAGRINARQGVAQGYNPTDYLREGAVRSATSVNPASLRENRLGTVMLRAQRLWTGGSLNAWVAPRLADAPNPAPFAADLGATNRRTRWLVAHSQQWGDDFAPQWLLYDDGDVGSPRLGLNLTRLLGPACVAHFEGSGGRVPSLRARAEGRAEADLAFRSQLAAGLTCATRRNLAVTVEYLRNGEALDATGWQSLRDGPAAAYLAYRQLAQQRQDPPTRHDLFVMLRWQNAFAPQWDLSGFARRNQADHSRLVWLEARYRGERTDWALQWQANLGGPLSEHGALPQRRLVQFVMKHYF